MEDEEEQGFTDSLDLVQKFRVKGVPFTVLYLPFSPQQTLISLSLSKSGQATLFGNLILAFFAQDGQADPKNDQKAYKDWLLRTIEETWNLFHKKFTALWDKHKDGSGEAYLPAIYNNPQLQQLVKQKFMSDLFHDTLGFGAAKMIRTKK